MSQELLQEQAERIAKRVDPGKVTKSFASILAIMLTVLPSLITCGQKEEPDPAKVNALIKAKNEKNPKRLRRQTAISIRREAPRDERPSAADAAELADATIAEACEAAPDVVEAMCRAYGG